MLYEKNQNRLKTCALCTNKIHKDHVVCEDHLEDMELYKHEFWFQELCRLEQRQYEIEVDEYRLIKHGSYPATLQKSTKPRYKLTQTQKNSILKLNNQGLGWRKIAKQLTIPPYTVNKFLYRYKKNGRQL